MAAREGDAETLSSLDGRAADAAPDGDFPVVDARFYDVQEEIARGGWGRILRAFDRRLGRMVAIKQLRASSALVESRLRREACLTARLEHPAIVPVHEVGRWPSGATFYVMKLVEGRSLQEVIEAASSLDERLPLVPHVLAVADAIAYAHARGVIHRDLKPSNVMIGAFGETLVIDWGLAKEVGEAALPGLAGDGDGAGDLTLAGSVVGTPPYLSPEQARGEPVDERADVYAIGAVLYTLVAGHGPYDGASADDIIRRVVAEPLVPVTRWQPTAPRDLVAVVAKAMARDPRERYLSARELAEDLRRFLSGRLVAAQSYSTPVLVARWLRVHRRGVALGAALAALTVALLVGAVRLRQQQAVAGARQAELVLMNAREELDRDPTAAVALLKRYAAAASADADDTARVAAEADGRLVARHVLPGMWGASIAADGRTVAGFDGARVRLFAVDTGAWRELVDPDGEISLLRFAADGARLAAIDGASLRLWDLAGGGSRRLLRREHLRWFDWSRDGRFIAVTDDAGKVDRVDTASGAVLERGGWTAGGMPWFSPDGHDLAVTWSGPVLLFHGDASQALTLPAPGGDWLAFAPDGQRLAWGTREGELRLYDLLHGAVRVVGNHGAQVVRLDFTPDGSHLASAGADGTLRLWDLGSGAVQALSWPGEMAAKLALSPDGALAAVGGLKGPVRLWDLATGLSRTLLGHTHQIRRLQFSGDGRTLVSSDQSGEARVWRVAPAAARIVAQRAPGASLQAGGSIVALASATGIDVWDAATGAARRIPLASNPSAPLVVTPDGRHAVTTSGSNAVVVDLGGGGVRPVSTGVTMRALALSPDGGTIAASGDESQIVLLAASGGAPPRVLGRQTTVVEILHFSPDGRALLSVAFDGARLWPLDGSPPAEFSPGELITEGSFAPDGRRVALIGGRGRAWLWTPGAGGARLLAGGGGRINRLAFAPDGSVLASAGDDRAVWLWDTSTGHARRLPHSTTVTGVTFIGDGRRLASAAADGAVRLWDVASGRELSALHVSDEPLEDVFSIGGMLIAVDAAHVWRVTPPTSAPASLGGLTTAELGADGVLSTPGAVAASRP